jgi:hypothetical protein
VPCQDDKDVVDEQDQQKQEVGPYNCLLKNIGKKDILNVQLTQRPTSSDSKRQQQMNSSRLDKWTESILKVKAIALFKSFSNKMSFIPLNRAISILLDFKHPS